MLSRLRGRSIDIVRIGYICLLKDLQMTEGTIQDDQERSDVGGFEQSEPTTLLTVREVGGCKGPAEWLEAYSGQNSR